MCKFTVEACLGGLQAIYTATLTPTRVLQSLVGQLSLVYSCYVAATAKPSPTPRETVIQAPTSPLCSTSKPTWARLAL